VCATTVTERLVCYVFVVVMRILSFFSLDYIWCRSSHVFMWSAIYFW